MAGGIGSGYHFLAGCSKHWFQSPQYRARKIVTTVEAQRAPQRLDGTAIRRDSSVVAEAQRRRTARGWTWASVIVRALTATINAPRFDPSQGLKQEASEIALKRNAPNPHFSGSPPVARTSERAHVNLGRRNSPPPLSTRGRSPPVPPSPPRQCSPAVPPSPPPSPAPVLSSGRHGSPAVPPTPPPTPPPSPAGIEVDVSNPVAAVCWTELTELQKGSVPTRLTVYPRADWGLRLADNKVSLGAHSFEMGNTVQRFIPVRRGNRTTGKGWWSTVKWDSAIPVRRGFILHTLFFTLPRLLLTVIVDIPYAIVTALLEAILPLFCVGFGSTVEGAFCGAGESSAGTTAQGGVVGALYGPKERLQDTAFFAFFFFDVFESRYREDGSDPVTSSHSCLSLSWTMSTLGPSIWARLCVAQTNPGRGICLCASSPTPT
ncbi:hypothetical protein DFH06DRAFT_1152660 [Mycena polygramma]|nr:hypothetical protein DFH06DRAFT_1152660 [Mycena polygramma]